MADRSADDDPVARDGAAGPGPGDDVVGGTIDGADDDRDEDGFEYEEPADDEGFEQVDWTAWREWDDRMQAAKDEAERTGQSVRLPPSP